MAVSKKIQINDFEHELLEEFKKEDNYQQIKIVKI